MLDYPKLYDRIKPDENLSVREIYARSKKDDDFEKASSKYTFMYTIGKIGEPSQRDYKVKKIIEKKVTICKRIWRGIKIAFYLNPTSSWFETCLNAVKKLVELRVQEVNEEFVKRQDPDVINCPNPTQEQLVKLRIINRLIKIAMGQS